MSTEIKLSLTESELFKFLLWQHLGLLVYEQSVVLDGIPEEQIALPDMELLQKVCKAVYEAGGNNFIEKHGDIYGIEAALEEKMLDLLNLYNEYHSSGEAAQEDEISDAQIAAFLAMEKKGKG